MKYRSIFFCFFLLTVQQCFSQAWVPKGTKWQFQFTPFAPFFPSSTDTITCIDTVMHLGRMCSRLHSSQTACSQMSFADQYMYTEGNRVFVAIDSGFYLMHDFNVQVGDTTWTTYINLQGQIDTSWIKITDIDSTLYCGDVKKLFWFDDITPDFQHYLGSYLPIIEDVGFGYFIYPQSGVCDPNTGPMKCFARSDCDPAQFGTCMSTTSIGDFGAETPDVHIYPNPGITYVQVRSASKLKPSLYNMFGQSLDIQIDYEGDQCTFHTASLPIGCYFLVFRDENGLQCAKKWVKQ